ncbi:juvenile hormone epoxide hydrolase-like [Anticarsia gemmatalis]|uniref:juvenile hormone epoxide hydrolase-like n=1 Tax=Anticarsia gemmatalis TaxID=129554 RepID=UPI003F76ECF5
MNSLRVLIVCCLVLGAFGSSLYKEEDENPIWTKNACTHNSARRVTFSYDPVAIEDLKQRINSTRKPTPPLQGINFEYGYNTDNLDRWLSHWANDYDFDARAALVDEFDHYITCVQGLNIHYVKVTPKVEGKCKVVPVLLIHGFPDTFLTYLPSAPYLTRGCVDGVALELIIPSVPGFGLSGGATKPGFSNVEVARVLKNLMNQLGYEKFYVQSGDCVHLGSTMATKFPEAVLGLHTNYAFTYNPLAFAAWVAGDIDNSLVVNSRLADRMFPLWDHLKYFITESGYLHMAATKPDTLGLMVNSSPAGLVALCVNVASYGHRHGYVHKHNGGLEDTFPLDLLLDHINVYWMTGSMTTALRLFAETFNTNNYNEGSFKESTNVPTYVMQAKHEVLYQSPLQLKIKYPNLLKTEVLDDYGHFVAVEQPELFAESVINAIVEFEEWHQNNGQRCEL